MKIRKTRREERGVYRYPVQVADGKGGYVLDYITIKPGEGGVTEANIKTLHSLDDSEVYYNCKNGRVPLTESQKEANAKWEAVHPGEEVEKNWNVSLEQLCENVL